MICDSLFDYLHVFMRAHTDLPGEPYFENCFLYKKSQNAKCILTYAKLLILHVFD